MNSTEINLGAVGDAATEAAAAFAAGAACASPVKVDIDRHQALVVPGGYQVHELDSEAYAPRPRRKRGTVKLGTVESFIQYVTAHYNDGTTVWVHPSDGEAVAVLDDHDHTDAGHGEHRAGLVLMRTDEWCFWEKYSGEMRSQSDFAEHIEDGAKEIIEPDAATMLEIAHSFHATTSANFRSTKHLVNGTVQMLYDEETQASAGKRGEMTIPTTFKLAISQFLGEERYAVTARLRYRVSNGKLTIGYRLERPDDVVRDAIKNVADRIAASAIERVYIGAPRI